MRILAAEGAKGLWRHAMTALLRRIDDRWAKNYIYQEWIKKTEKVSRLPSAPNGLSVMVVTVIERKEDLHNPALLRSLRMQDFQDWTLRVFVSEHIADWTRCFNWSRDHRIELRIFSNLPSSINQTIELEGRGNRCIVLLCSTRSLLSEGALGSITCLFQEERSARIAYFDEDRIGVTGRRFDPFCKPDWSPLRLLCSNYLGDALAFRCCPQGFFDLQGIESFGAFIYGLGLKASTTLAPNEIKHIPLVLRHLPCSLRSFKKKALKMERDAKEAREVLCGHLVRNGLSAQVLPGLAVGSNRVRWRVDGEDEVEIIIPTKNKADYLERCIDSIIAAQGYPEYRVSVVDTGSDEREALGLHQKYSNDPRVFFTEYCLRNFNYAEVNNWAARRSKAKYLLFMNNDTEVIGDDWLSALLEYGQQAGVGIVGPKMVFPDGSLQHMGVVLGIRNGVGHVGYGYDDSREMGFPFLQAKDSVREVSAVTGACLLVRRDEFANVGGFDERFRKSYNDIDLCMKMRARGLLVVYTPYTKIIHHESVSFGRIEMHLKQGMDEYEHERALFNRIWALENHVDPYYSPNLTVLDESMDYRLQGLNPCIA